ncbi:hypothetical protein EBU24_03605 [bacterium]|nr:hypothetical protein [bacterium]
MSLTLSLSFLTCAHASEQMSQEELVEQQELIQEALIQEQQSVDMELEPTVGRIVYVQKNPKKEEEGFVIKRRCLTNSLEN